MVAIIKTGHSIHNIFNYNENKVKQGVAVCIGEGNYPVDATKMNATMKLNRFLKQLDLNDNVKRNSVHISLNFDSIENNISKEKLMDIADTYMEKIGFGQQPYLVYQHHDAGHPHIHIVSIKVRADGSRIDMQNIGRNQSETARKEIEKSFGLVVAQSGSKKQPFELLPIHSGKIHYGKIQSKKAIANVLNAVLPSYKYASLPELNAVLQQYNVYADRGSENSRIFKLNGLVYRILDQNGKPIGVPIKASDFHTKPTLKFLEDKFITNKNKPITHAKRIKNLIDLAFLNQKLTLTELTKILEKQGIAIVSRTNSEGLIYGITYVDHTTKCVFNGSSLGKEYSAKAIQERCGSAIPKTLEVPFVKTTKMLPSTAKVATANEGTSKETILGNTLVGELLEILIEPEYVSNYLPNPLKKRHKKRKRKGQSDNP
ncbi:relaxase/mobilization nuclease domain-containing protein [Flavobacterium muglaense]|uniref:Relaxase/mobilization nuclease domain-containing protein n=1 Tax=Flavobacterium muglaense TaxID=2764716 RepID=A0A923MYE8_9FLAO|nr:relaxase/mobilization nuclease domain-containing protein [Flavobacterium muglaense]MBC5836701.1 relaxase/mobilization nuclease domain-containing protein [Flavobacterium muglaense]MBC5843349.1 relaxase/mobilization nuclease domain-containing protein [Flavobacterium muglaense]